MPSVKLAADCEDFSDLEVGPGPPPLPAERQVAVDRPGRRARRRAIRWPAPTRSGSCPLLDGKPEGLALTRNGRAMVALDTKKAKENLVLLDPPIAAVATGHDPTLDHPEHAPRVASRVRRGGPHPLGATPDAEGTNFAVFSQHATSGRAAHLRAPRLAQAGQGRSSSTRPSTGPSTSGTSTSSASRRAWAMPTGSTARRTSTAAGHRFNPNKVLIDPYGRGTTSTLWDRVAACGPDDNVGPLAQQRRHRHDRLRLGGRHSRSSGSMQDTVIYEMHVRGFTKSPTSGATQPRDVPRARSTRSRTSRGWASPRSSCCRSSSSTRTRSAAPTR